MEEKVIAVGKTNVRSLKLFRNVCLIGALCIFVLIMASWANGLNKYGAKFGIVIYYYLKNGVSFGEIMNYVPVSDVIYYELIPIAICIIGIVLYFWFSRVQITVTDMRVYGVIAGGKRVDLPLDSISAIATAPFKGIAVTTSSGGIKFLGIQNRDEIHDSISKLLLSRQNNKSADKTVLEKDEADSLVKYKKLLDDGVITQEEYEAKKKQLLGL